MKARKTIQAQLPNLRREFVSRDEGLTAEQMQLLNKILDLREQGSELYNEGSFAEADEIAYEIELLEIELYEDQA